MAAPLPPTMRLAMIRVALTLSVLTLGAVTYWLMTSGRVTPVATAAQARQLVWVAYGVWGLAIAALVALRWTKGTAIERGTAPNLLVIAWALGEGVAAFGAVFWLLTGSSSLFGAGLVVFAAAFLLFPLRAR